LLFVGFAEKRLELESIARYGEGDAGRAGSVQPAAFSLNDQLFMCIDSPVKHQFAEAYSHSEQMSVVKTTEKKEHYLKRNTEHWAEQDCTFQKSATERGESEKACGLAPVTMSQSRLSIGPLIWD
jgi:predicted 3-demethylubiquinone-9 3-methyltransferase (glyoxalase superfamily)